MTRKTTTTRKPSAKKVAGIAPKRLRIPHRDIAGIDTLLSSPLPINEIGPSLPLTNHEGKVIMPPSKRSTHHGPQDRHAKKRKG